MSKNEDLICPNCKLPRLKEHGTSLVCESCKKEYTLKDSHYDLYISDDYIINKEKIHDTYALTETNLKNWAADRVSLSGVVVKVFSGLYGWLWVIITPYLILGRGSALSAGLFLSSLFVAIITANSYYDARRKEFTRASKYLLRQHRLSQLSEYDMRKTLSDEDGPCLSAQKELVESKRKEVAYFVNRYLRAVNDKKDVLVIGCGGDIHSGALAPYSGLNATLNGVDIHDLYIREFLKQPGRRAVMANCLSLPFQDERFDAVNMTDVLEHLHSPLLGLSEACRVLKKGGVLLVTTPNRHVMNYMILLNPILFFLLVISFATDKALSERAISTTWMDHEFYHTSFSKKKLLDIFAKVGLRTEEMFTYDYVVKPLEAFGRRIPFLRCLGGEWCVVLRK